MRRRPSPTATGRRSRRGSAQSGVGHLVHMSSVGAYSPAPGLRVDESWPVRGLPTSAYSLDKAAAERTMSIYETELPSRWFAPAFILQDAAASEIHRYFLGPLVPRALFRRSVLSRVPVPSALNTQVVHADAVADAIAHIVEQRATGAFNVAADPVISRGAWRKAFGGVGPDLSPSFLRRSMSVSWRLRLDHAAPSWLDLALALPTLDCGRLQQLGWSAGRNALQVLKDFAVAMTRGSGRPGPLLHRADDDRPAPAHDAVLDRPDVCS